MALALAGRLGEAASELRAVLELARAHDDVATEQIAESNLAQVLALTGDGEAVEHALNAVRIAERIGGLSVSNVYFALALAYEAAGELEAARSAAERCLQQFELLPHRVCEGPFRGVTAMIEMFFDPAEAAARARGALELQEQIGSSAGVPTALIVLAMATMQLGGPEAATQARATIERALAVGRECGYKIAEPFARQALGMVAMMDGDQALAGAEMSAARELFETMGAHGRAARLAELVPAS
jgi:tetratricopeptide (TPR) repeat protein